LKEETSKLLEKAARAVRAAKVLGREGDRDFAVSRVYYAMFYTAGALLSEKGLRYRKHSGVSSALGEHFVKTGRLNAKYHRWLLDAFDRRIQGDYGLAFAPDTEEVDETIDHAGQFLEVARQLLETTP
jgi:uncharacterized protein (UPF0332 family)